MHLHQLQLQGRTMEELSLHLPVPAMPSSREDIKFDFYLGKVRRETQVKRPNKSKLKDDSLTNIPLISQSFSTAGMCMSFGNLE
ncbi:hypothetical protein L3X38_006434 [Prunus dulcis]|uniref:Uncharacterized protein n=1 Tax=Prunus dulcis TaxID=3755 RepID=A0AAD5F575_PRUDU|nr:hypothetical protein L3X38_006434 [Prunus dulcis]